MHTRNFALFFIAILLSAAQLTALQPDGTTRQTSVLYDGDLGGTPDTQGLDYVALTPSVTQSFTNGATTLDTTGERFDQAGYFVWDNPPLEREKGYSVQFTVQLVEEVHSGPNRAGFSLLVLSADLQGIELGFWANEIWAQEGGKENLFTHAEGIAFDTAGSLTAYELQILDDAYTLSVDGSPILTGPIRDYTAFEGFIDPYETPNLLFLGDDSTTSQANVNIAYVALETIFITTLTPTPTAPPTATPEDSATPWPTATATATPAAAAAKIVASRNPPRWSYWWFSLTSGYPPSSQQNKKAQENSSCAFHFSPIGQ